MFTRHCRPSEQSRARVAVSLPTPNTARAIELTCRVSGVAGSDLFGHSPTKPLGGRQQELDFHGLVWELDRAPFSAHKQAGIESATTSP